MKIVFDIDGTLTDFNRYIEQKAIPYFMKKYGMEVVNKELLEVEDIMDMHNHFIKKGCSPEESINQTNKALKKYWQSYRFFAFSLLGKFRPGLRKTINKLIKEGHDVEVHTSRGKTCEDSLVGTIARRFTIWQIKLNGLKIKSKKIHFYKDDKYKIEAIISSVPEVIFEDKKEVIELIAQQLPSVKILCVDGRHNQDLREEEGIFRVKSFVEFDRDTIFSKMYGKKLYNTYVDAAQSNKFFNRIYRIPKRLVLKKFHPIILNKHNLLEDFRGGVYVPNHITTLDPVILTAFLEINIHWAALQRFFSGEDSIFNNNKNLILCKMTAYCFNKLKYFPIQRFQDFSNADNFYSISQMVNYLKIGENVGIFAEGTTQKEENQIFGEFNPIFIRLARKTGAWIKPIHIYKDKTGQYVINFAKPYQVDGSDVYVQLERYMKIQHEMYKECESYRVKES